MSGRVGLIRGCCPGCGARDCMYVGADGLIACADPGCTDPAAAHAAVTGERPRVVHVGELLAVAAAAGVLVDVPGGAVTAAIPLPPRPGAVR